MKKEVFLAISIGFALGLVITFGIWTANKSLAGIKNSPGTPTPTQTPPPGATPAPQVTSTPNSSSLSLTSPVDEIFSSKNSITVSGKTSANATIVILFEGDDKTILADAQGTFSTDVALIPGYNNVVVNAFDSQGNKSSQSVIVTYSTAKI